MILLRKAICSFGLLVALASCGAMRLHAQAASAYDVSTVKPSKDSNNGMMLNWGDDSLDAQNVTLQWMVINAFHLRRDQLQGLPTWAADQHWDIKAKLTDIDPQAAKNLSVDQHRALLQALLRERFALKAHTESKVMPTFDLLPAKGGVRIEPGETTKKIPGVCPGCAMSGRAEMKAQNIEMSGLVEMISGELQRNVANHTGIPDTNKVDFVLKFAPQDGKPAPGGDDSAEPLPAALEHQLGVRLVSTKGPVTLLVIDSLQKPTDN